MGPRRREDRNGGREDGSPHSRGQEGEVPMRWEKTGDHKDSPYGLRVSMSDEGGGRGWVPACARTRGGWVWRWRGTLPARGGRGMGPRIREDRRGMGEGGG